MTWRFAGLGLLAAIGCSPPQVYKAEPAKTPIVAPRHVPEVCRRAWMPSVKHAGVLSPKLVEQALRAPFAATRVRFCACASRFETSPTRVRFVVRTFPDRGEASVELAAGNDLAPDFEACLGTIEARYRAFEIGSDCINCGTGEHQGVEIVYPLVVDLSEPR